MAPVSIPRCGFLRCLEGGMRGEQDIRLAGQVKLTYPR